MVQQATGSSECSEGDRRRAVECPAEEMSLVEKEIKGERPAEQGEYTKGARQMKHNEEG